MKRCKQIFAYVLLFALIFTSRPLFSYAALKEDVIEEQQEGKMNVDSSLQTDHGEVESAEQRKLSSVSNNWSWPTTTTKINANWGRYPSGGIHSGIDFAAPMNSPVYATCDGQVVSVRSMTTSYGNHIKIKATVNGHIVYIRYCHLNSYIVSNGQNVKAGQLIGYSGNTGNSTGPHLHYEVRNANDYYNANEYGAGTLNPSLYLPGSSYTYSVNGTSSSSNPIGRVDEIKSVEGGITVSGWAFDSDAAMESVEINVYIGGAYGEANVAGYSAKADQERIDVGDAYQGVGNYHGFSLTAMTNKTGTQPIYVYALNVGTGENTVLWSGTIDIQPAFDPFGNVEICEGEDGKVHIKGWAFDKSDISKPVSIHIYNGGKFNEIVADKYRPDVDDVYPGVGDYHGFDTYITTDLVGETQEQVYAINIGPGTHFLLYDNTVYIKPVGVENIQNGTYYISSAIDDKAMVGFDKTGKNLAINQMDENETQKFEITAVGHSRYSISIGKTKENLDIVNADLSNGASIQRTEFADTPTQKWILKDAGDGYYYIFNSANGRCIDLADGNTANNNNIRMFDFNGSAAQKWKLSPVLDKVVMNDLENTSTGVKISWNALENAKSYQIARRTPGTEWSVLKKGVTGTSYIDETAKEGVTYYYTVYGLNGNFGSSVSDETKSITCYRVPEDVSLTSLVNTAVGVRLRWNEVENADVYRIYRRTANGSWQLLSRTITGTTCIDKTAKTGEKYYYAVRAQNGNSVSQGYDTKKSITCIREMGKVKINSLTDVGSGVNVKWDYLYGADTYRVYRKEAGGQWICLKTGIKRNTFTDTTAKKQNTYYYTVKPENGEVVGMEYDGSKSIAYGKTLGKVTLTSMENIKEGVHLSWGTVPGAETYRVIRRISGSEWGVIASGIKRPVYTDTTAEPEQKYFYAVLAENGDNLSSEFDSKRWIIYGK